MNILNKILLASTMTLLSLAANGQTNPKREFRGAWIQCVNGQYLNKSMAEIRQMLSSQLDVLQEDGINAIMFQVRAEGDALYQSHLEPWSRYLTGTQGMAPSDGWDPLGWMVEQCHQRGMELHAWINPYRAKTKGTTALDSRHSYMAHPERIFPYGDLLIFNPALKENRDYTCQVITDILENYDVDGLHIDDYFYPYPENGIPIPDQAYFAHDPRGFANIDDWRRDNVSLLIKDIHATVRRVKPWVKFGVSPFGIYRNSPTGMNSREGSATKGTQNYDDLYADIVLWQDKGWVDYLIPQIYWNIGTTVADYQILCHWWNDYCNKRPLFIGQDVERTVKGMDPNNPQSHQMVAKYSIQRELEHIQGSCQWYAAAVVNNPGNYGTMLATYYHKTPALQPLMPFIDKKAPKKVKGMDIVKHNGQPALSWEAPKAKKEMDKAVQYVVYRFMPKEKVNLERAENILGITRDEFFILPPDAKGCTFVVTSLDRLHNESKPAVVRL